MKAADEYRESLGVNTIRGFEHGAVRQDVYDQVFLREPEHPYSTIMMSQKERYASTHLLYSRSAEFLLYDGATKTGMSFNEFIKMPTYWVEFMLSTLRQHSKETRHDGKNLQKEIEKMGEQVEGFTNMKQR